MIRIIRFLFIAILFITPLRSLIAQPVLVSDMLPLSVGQYVDYTQYDTATANATPTKSHASYTVLQNGLSFQGATGVYSVLDSLGSGDPSGYHNLHYLFTSTGDLQVFADTALLNDIFPGTLTAGIKQVPNRWIDKYKTSAGTNVVYQIDTINTTYSSGGQTADVTIYLSGQYDGPESLTVNGVNYPTAYRFESIAKLTISLGSFTLGTLNLTQSDWLVKGIGIVRTSQPLDSTKILTTEVAAGGRDKEMTADGIASSGVSRPSTNVTGITIYPDPASDAVTISLPKPAKQILLYADDGIMARSFDISGKGAEALLWINDMPNGYYVARVKFADGTMGSASMIVQH